MRSWHRSDRADLRAASAHAARRRRWLALRRWWAGLKALRLPAFGDQS